MEYIAFNAHKHDTLASVAKPDGELVPEERIEPHNGWHRVLPSRSAASPGPRLPVDDLFERHHASHLTSEGDCDVSSTGRHEIEDVDDFHQGTSFWYPVRRAVCPRSRLDRARPAGRLHDNAFEFSTSPVAADFFAT